MSRADKFTLAATSALVVLTLVLPASATAGDTPSTTITTETAPPPATTSTPAPAPEAPPQTTSSTTESTPAPQPQTTVPAPTSTAPQVSSQHAQGSTPSSQPGGGAGAHAGKKAPKGGNQGGSGSAAKPKRGQKAPKPSALTPALPLSLTTSISGVPAFFIESFRIPPFLLPIYQAAGTAYGVPWQVLAAINEVETDYGRDLSVSSAGAEGWMQFLPSSWATYGVDANGDGFKDPYNPADAIFAAARYLRAAGADTDLRGAIFSYNHSQAYVESVMLRAKLLGGTPQELLGAITGLTEARFPVHAKSHFSDGFQSSPGGGSAKPIVGTTIYSEQDAPAIAVQDGQVVQVGESPELGHFLVLRDAYGNTYTYAQLANVATLYPVLKPHDGQASSGAVPRAAEAPEPRPTGPATAGAQPGTGSSGTAPPEGGEGAGVSALSPGAGSGLGGLGRAEPGSGAASSLQSPAPSSTSNAPAAQPPPAGSTEPVKPQPRSTTLVFRSGPNDVYLRPLRAGVRVIAGTVLGHVGGSTPGGLPGDSSGEPHMLFQIRPASVGAPLIDPKPILDGWVQLENTSIFRANGRNAFTTTAPSPGQVLLESKEQLEQQVLANPGISIYPCGRQDIETDQIDRRVLATLEFLEVSGLKPTVSALKCGHSEETTEGNISEHSTGDAVDISEINGIPIAGHQGPGSITDTAIRKLLTLQGSMKPHQIISLMSYPGADNTLAKADHYNHIHVGFAPLLAQNASLAGSLTSTITPTQWIKLIARLGEIPDPTVASTPSAAAIPAPTHRGEG